MFDLNSVSVAYGDAPVLKEISLRIREGEQIVIIGASGAGKTTLLRKLFDLQAQRAAFIHQNYALVPQLSVFHNVCAGRLNRHSAGYNLLNLVRPRKQELEAVTPLLEALGMADKRFERVGNLSGGQQQRVAVARAVYRAADILLGDEPVSSIDPHQAGAVLDLLKQRSNTLILAMHDVRLALGHFDRILGLRLGKIVFDLPGGKVDNKTLTDLYRPC